MNLGGAIHLNRGTLLAIIVFCIVIIVLYRNNGEVVNSEMRTESEVLKDMNIINLRLLLVASIDAATRGGHKVYTIHKSQNLNERSKGKTKEGVNDPVTDGDQISHLEMFHSIANTFPSLSIVSEERSTHSLLGNHVAPAETESKEIDSLNLPDLFVDYKDVLVWIDPLDATKEYTENLLQYVTTLVCVAVKGRPVIGVIHKPFSNTTVWVWVNHAFYNNTITVPPKKKIPKDVKIIVSRSHKGKVENVSKSAFGPSVSITGAGGAGYKVLEVVQGHQDVYVHTSLIKKWDICAGNALLEHLHGSMTTLKGNLIDYGSSQEATNPDGIVAALFNHKYYLQKLSAIKS